MSISTERKKKVPAPGGSCTHKVPHNNWTMGLADAIEKAMPGDTIECHTDAMAELGEIARGRLCGWKEISFVVNR